ncbi:hypothetical protein [Sediminibacillus massiliensis]|uniref:hypothetical protein n=1 Tax=Sediminibacillus massiliensis TaxID=1926277 RepID=UPI000988695E|nr:hypothetical protein [Sediminibacillus massiliensis]
MEKINWLIVNNEEFKVGKIYNGRLLEKIKGYANDPRNNREMACYIGLDQDEKVLFEIFSTNVIAFYEKEDEHART